MSVNWVKSDEWMAEYNGSPKGTEAMEALGRAEMAEKGLELGAGCLVEEGYVYLSTFATVPGTWGHPQAEWSAKIMDGKWIVSRTGLLR